MPTWSSTATPNSSRASTTAPSATTPQANIDLEGAIDIPKVRDRITGVMEGGEKAFNLRKAKYGF